MLANIIQRHIFGGRLLSIHNLRFLIKLTEELREAIKTDTILEYKENFIKEYCKNDKGVKNHE